MNEGFDNYGVPQNNGGGKGMAIAALILGIISIVLCCIWYVSAIAGIIAIVLGILHNKNNGKTGMATAGIICGIVGIILAIVIIVIGLIGLAAFGGLSALEGYY